MANQQQAPILEELEQELAHINARIEAAAVEEDAGAFVALLMRRAAIPALIREVRAAPIRAEIKRLEDESGALEDEARRVREEPPPDVPPARRGHVTAQMLMNARLESVTTRASAVGKEIKAKRELLARIEAEGPRPSD